MNDYIKRYNHGLSLVIKILNYNIEIKLGNSGVTFGKLNFTLNFYHTFEMNRRIENVKIQKNENVKHW